jgi:Txe/YoeB family toxin of Txe-Axe toxin-antitoxin module
MLYVSPFSTLDVTFIDKATNTIYEANVEQLETEILELLNNLILEAYNSDKNFWKLVDQTHNFHCRKILQSRLIHTLDDLSM